MSNFGKNIRKIRSVKKMNQTALADLFNLTRASIGAYEEGRAEPKIDTLISIANYFSISIESLLTKDLTINEITHFDKYKSTFKTANYCINNSKDKDKNAIPYLKISKFDKYIIEYKNISFIDALPVIKLPLQNLSGLRAFDHSGNEMYYNNTGICHGDILICIKLNIENTKFHSYSEPCVVVLKNEIVTRFVQSQNDIFHLNSFNPDCRNHINIVQADDILEIWKVEGIFTTYIKTTSSIEDRLSKLENEKLGN